MLPKTKKILQLDQDNRYQIRENNIEKNIEQVRFFSLGLARDIGFAVAVPIAGGALLGVWLDQKFGTKPKLTLSFLFAGIILSMVSFGKIVLDIIKASKTKK
jgi:predicted F0F1-ATPase subunit